MIKGEEAMSAMNAGVLIACRQRKVWDLGGGRGGLERFKTVKMGK